MIEVAENGPERLVTHYILDIQVTGINDYAPLFLFSPYTVYIDEDKTPGSVVSNPIPYDFDKGVDGQTTSRILGRFLFICMHAIALINLKLYTYTLFGKSFSLLYLYITLGGSLSIRIYNSNVGIYPYARNKNNRLFGRIVTSLMLNVS